jgi:hypothetical protein
MPDEKTENENVIDGFHVVTWLGQKRYLCNQKWESGEACQFDSYDINVTREHAAQPHTYTGRALRPGEDPAKKHEEGPQAKEIPLADVKNAKFAIDK